MDGVIVNSIPALYSIYYDFLNDFGHQGNAEECNWLNGPKIEEIVEYLKSKYQLEQSIDALVDHYCEKIDLIYDHVDLNPEVTNTLEKIKNYNFSIALASSAKRNNILKVLKRFEISHYFDYVVSGDNVKNAKPQPDIYLKVSSRYPDHDYYVIEDSINGAKAAIAADMNVIFFNQKDQISPRPSFRISQMGELATIIDHIKSNLCEIIATSNQINLIQTDPKIDVSCKEEVDLIWEAAKKQNPSLHNGKIICYDSHQVANSELTIKYFESEYKFFLAKQRNTELPLHIKPLAVSGVILDINGKTLLSIRNRVTEYSGYYEFVPSGGLRSESSEAKRNILALQIMEELEEETLIPREWVDRIDPFALVYDTQHQVYDLCLKIHIKRSLEGNLDLLRGEEYSNWKVIDFSDLPSFFKDHLVVPTSFSIFNLLHVNNIALN